MVPGAGRMGMIERGLHGPTVGGFRCATIFVAATLAAAALAAERPSALAWWEHAPGAETRKE